MIIVYARLCYNKDPSRGKMLQEFNKTTTTESYIQTTSTSTCEKETNTQIIWKIPPEIKDNKTASEGSLFSTTITETEEKKYPNLYHYYNREKEKK